MTTALNLNQAPNVAKIGNMHKKIGAAMNYRLNSINTDLGLKCFPPNKISAGLPKD